MAVTFERIKDAAAALKGEVAATPMSCSRTLSALFGCEIWLKFENLQFTASFKERGALAKLKALGPAERQRGVIAMSAGNHAQAVAYHAQRLGIPATIVMPETTPHVKVKHTEDFGAEVILAGEGLSEASARALQLAESRSLVFVHPYDDEHVIAGQGTVALEMLSAVPALDALIVPVGGGGLIAGCAVAAHALNPKLEIFGVEAALYPSIANALHGRLGPCAGSTIAEGIAVKTPGALTLPIIKAEVADILLASEIELERAVSDLVNIEKTVAEGAGAAALAGLAANRARFEGRKVGLILSGGNIDPRLLAYVLLRERARAGCLLTLHIEAKDRPGFLARVAGTIGKAGGNIIDVTHSRLLTGLPAKEADIGFTIETRDAAHGRQIVQALRDAGIALRRRGDEEEPFDL
jgi:threonine dehydratase